MLSSQLLRIGPPEAGARVKAAAHLGPRRGLTGEVLPALFEPVAAAQAAGAISPAHARVITDTVDRLPRAIRAEHEQWVQESLVEQAHTTNPWKLGQVARTLAYLLDQDGILVDEHDRQRCRGLRITRRPDGSAHLDGELTALSAEALLTALNPLAQPAPAGPDGVKDPRNCGQRLHDALYDSMLMLLRTGQLPDASGVAATIVLHLTPEHLHTRTGLVATGHGAHVPVSEALTLYGDARASPSCSANRVRSSTTPPPPAVSSPRANAWPWPPATAAAPPPAAPSPPADVSPPHHRLRDHPTNLRR